ncbi:MAG: hypothetical protein IPI88_12845 [Chitinophagaceae bacterium]|nr:hypothetical protein [Chitinophagaceae bacterium]
MMNLQAVSQLKYYSAKPSRQQKGFVQLGLDIETIIGSTYPSICFGGRNSAGQYF